MDFKPITEFDNLPKRPDATLVPKESGTDEAGGSVRLIDAETDAEAVNQWLSEYADRPNTFPAYRKEAERFLNWLRAFTPVDMRSMKREHWLAYERFLLNPDPTWCGRPHKRSHRDYRPFQGPLSNDSKDYAMAVLNDMVSYLVAGGYLEANPLALRRKARSSPLQKIERYLPPASYEAIMSYIESMPRDTAERERRYERALFVMTWTEATGARASELLNTKMSHIKASFRSRETQWWWEASGKGKKESKVPLNDAAIEALKRYRTHLGLDSPLPDGTEQEKELPLVWGVRGDLLRRSEGITRASLYRMTKPIFKGAAAILDQTDPAAARQLEMASTHWLRHSTATNAFDSGMDTRDVQDFMRHASPTTTRKYDHQDPEAFHRRSTRRPSPFLPRHEEEVEEGNS